MFKYRSILPALLVALLVPAAPVAEENGPDLSRWRCRFCAFETGKDGSLSMGFGLVFDDAFRFGNATGLEKDGAFFNGDISLTWWDEGARFYELNANKLGTRARDISISGGIQGTYKFFVGYDEIPYRVTNSGASPFSGIGSAALTLPGNWQPSGVTWQMQGLADALQPVEIGQDRRTFSAGLEFRPADRWLHEINYRHRIRDGLQPFSGNFLTLSTILAAPVDFTTDIIEATVAYTADQWQAKLGYYGSSFSNDAPILSWQNPFSPLLDGADGGAAARPPDNDFHQLTLSGNYRFGGRTRMVGHLGIGKASQNNLFALYTVNSSINAPPLPANSANARIDSTMLNGGVRLSGHFAPQVSYKAYYRKHERDNDTPVLDLQPVVTDVFLGGMRRNTPFSFDKSEYGLDVAYRVAGHVRATVGAEREDYERDFQEVRKTKENTYWLDLAASAGEMTSANLRLRHQNRDGTGYRPVSSLDLPENPLLRKFNMADRDRDQLSANISLMPHTTTSISLSGEFASDDYPDSIIGLNESEERSYTLDVNYSPTAKLSLYGFYTRQAVEYMQTGSQTGDINNLWAVRGEDRFITHGLNLRLTSEDQHRRLALEYVRTDSQGSSLIETTTGMPAFPDLTTNMESLALDLRLEFRDNLATRIRYMYERYHSRDWTYESVQPDTIANVLTLGEDLPNYSEQVLWLGLVRSF